LAQDLANVSTALIRLEPSRLESRFEPSGDGAAKGYAGARPRADFLAQLIATVGQAPQTRLRRRAEPGDAVAAYNALGRSGAPVRRALSRSL
jgi:hypothetical protein